MFNKKQIEELRELIDSSFGSIQDQLDNIKESQKENSSKIEELKEEVNNNINKLNNNHENISIKIDTELERMIKTAEEFERSIASFNNLKNRLDDMLYKKINEVVDAELSTVRKKLSEFKGVEEDFSELTKEIKHITGEINKFNNISKSIKEVDFTLHSHAKDIQKADRIKLELEKENEKLKDILAKMKRGERRQRLR